MILTASDLRDLAEVLLYNCRNLVIVLVASLTMCEESLRVLSGTTSYRTLWRECAVAETLDVVHVNEWTNILLIHFLDLVVLVRCTEAIEEVDEWNLCLKCSEVRNSCKIHNLLYRTRAEHSETCLTASHYILVVTEDTQRVRSKCTC